MVISCSADKGVVTGVSVLWRWPVGGESGSVVDLCICVPNLMGVFFVCLSVCFSFKLD